MSCRSVNINRPTGNLKPSAVGCLDINTIWFCFMIRYCSHEQDSWYFRFQCCRLSGSQSQYYMVLFHDSLLCSHQQDSWYFRSQCCRLSGSQYYMVLFHYSVLINRTAGILDLNAVGCLDLNTIWFCFITLFSSTGQLVVWISML